MNRQEAEEALGIIRKVIRNTHEDLIAHNWGLIWMVHAFLNLGGFWAVGHFIEHRDHPVTWYLIPLAVTAALDLGVILILLKRDQGIRSFIEWQLHGIWVTFILFSIAGVGFLHLSKGPATLFGPIMALTSGIGFSLMGIVFYRRFLLFGALFFVLTLTAPLLVEFQWLAIGLGWFVALFSSGLSMHLEKGRREQEGTGSEIA